METTSRQTDTGLRERFMTAFRTMALARALETKLSSLYHAGKVVGGVYTGKGQEAFSAALAMQLVPGKDVYGPLIRDQAGRLAFGEPLADAPRTYFGSVEGPMRGRDGNVHRGRPADGVPAMISHLGSLISVVCGMLMARRFKGVTGIVGATSIGEGATSTGAFHESINLAAVEKLPLIVAVANNQFAYSTPTSRQFACADLVDKAAGYGVSGHTVDGTDLEACLDVFERAVRAGREGGGPQLVIGTLLRLSGHGEHDDASYVGDDLKKGTTGRDCLPTAEATAIARGWATVADIEAIHGEAAEKVRAAIASVQREASPDPFSTAWHSLVTQRLIEGESSDSVSR